MVFDENGFSKALIKIGVTGIKKISNNRLRIYRLFLFQKEKGPEYLSDRHDGQIINPDDWGYKTEKVYDSSIIFSPK